MQPTTNDHDRAITDRKRLADGIVSMFCIHNDGGELEDIAQLWDYDESDPCYMTDEEASRFLDVHKAEMELGADQLVDVIVHHLMGIESKLLTAAKIAHDAMLMSRTDMTHSRAFRTLVEAIKYAETATK